jgi:hypothetical protein
VPSYATANNAELLILRTKHPGEHVLLDPQASDDNGRNLTKPPPTWKLGAAAVSLHN